MIYLTVIGMDNGYDTAFTELLNGNDDTFDSPRYISLSQAAVRYSCSRRTLKRMIKSGMLPAYDLSMGMGKYAKYRIDVHEADAVVKARRVQV